MQINRQLRATALQMRRAAGNIICAGVLGRDHILPYFRVYHANYVCDAEFVLPEWLRSIITSE